MDLLYIGVENSKVAIQNGGEDDSQHSSRRRRDNQHAAIKASPQIPFEIEVHKTIAVK
jgi:hypothetical protein